MTTVLIALTGSSVWTMRDGTTVPAGFWADEFLDPYAIFQSAGHSVLVATPAGVAAPVQQYSLDESMTGSAQRSAQIRAELSAMAEIVEHPSALADVDPTMIDAIYIPGGHGPMEDLYADFDLGRILIALQRRVAPIVTTCHGTIGLLSARTTDGQCLYDGYEMTGYSDEEERLGGTGVAALFTLESRLRAEGAKYIAHQPWSPFVVVDRNLITGQNPASATDVATKLVAALARTS
ncbi:putative intracellular protease/amidase [Nakamurella sp. UYEF19]|uniref:type 1 glutamine amidotransferase domain-containing protein n=1 Tax=Nakamurella sp. UYEF19 TaxID=1756392 RepID=UPI003394B88B